MCLLRQFRSYRNSSKNCVKKSKSEFLTLKQEILSMIVCSIENDSCILRECEICKYKTITEKNFHLEEDSLFDEITFEI